MIRYITWKYWHTPFLHGLTAVVVAAYDMYTECAEGKIYPAWFISEKKRMTWRKFCLRLSAQQLTYTPKKGLYNKFLALTVLPSIKQERAVPAKSNSSVDTHGDLTAVTFKRANTETRRSKPRLCGDLNLFSGHVKSTIKTTNHASCEVCGKGTQYKCGICNKQLCLFAGKTMWMS